MILEPIPFAVKMGIVAIRHYQLVDIFEDAMFSNIQYMNRAVQFAVVILNGIMDFTFSYLPHCPIWKTGLRIALPTVPFAFSVVTIFWHWRSISIQLLLVDLYVCSESAWARFEH